MLIIWMLYVHVINLILQGVTEAVQLPVLTGSCYCLPCVSLRPARYKLGGFCPDNLDVVATSRSTVPAML